MKFATMLLTRCININEIIRSVSVNINNAGCYLKEVFVIVMKINKALLITCGGQVKNGVGPLFAAFEELHNI